MPFENPWKETLLDIALRVFPKSQVPLNVYIIAMATQ